MLRPVLLCFAGLLLAGSASAQQFIPGGPVAPDGQTEAMVDFPGHQKTKNTGGSDGEGLCVATSVMHSARWQNELRLVDFQDKVRREPGGSWPEKLDRQIAKYAAGAPYLQYVGTDLAILEAALKTGRLPAITYSGHDGVFYSGYVSHMVNLVHLDQRYAAILDNNYTGEKQILWMPREEFAKRWRSGGQGWAVFLLAPPPPPIPTLTSGGQLGRAFERGTAAVSEPIKVGRYYEWKVRADDPHRRYLYEQGQLLGAWDVPGSYWRAYGTTAWGEVENFCPLDPPVEQRRVVYNFGVDRLRLPRGENYTLSGRAATKTEAFASLTVEANLPDDSKKLRLTVIGNEDLRQRILADLATSPALQPWKERLLVQAYPSGHWAISGLGFPAQGVIVQQPGPDGRGKVIHQQLHYENADQLAGALRRADPHYMPDRAPNLTGPDLLKWGSPWIEIALIAFTIVICYLCFRSAPRVHHKSH